MNFVSGSARNLRNFCLVTLLIVSITKFSIVIGSPRVYLSRNWRAITWVSNYSCPISTFCNWIPVIGHRRHSDVNYVHSNGFFLYCVQNVWNIPLTFSIKTEVVKDFLTSKFVIDTIN